MSKNTTLQKPAMKNFMVHPCIIANKHTLVYERGLEQKDPDNFHLLTLYAGKNGYVLKEDQRANFIEGIKRVENSSRANVITILILTASLLSQNVSADFSNYLGIKTPISDIEQIQVYPRVEIDDASYATIESLMDNLVGWINQHTSFEHHVDSLPKLIIAAPDIIAEVAFGGKLPGNVDAASLNIMGLYNFNEKAIYLLDDLDLNTEEGKGILLHELVHYLQYQEDIDKNVECKNELEALAYMIEAKYLNTQHVKHSITQNHINKISECK
jgi:hypothetical protein